MRRLMAPVIVVALAGCGGHRGPAKAPPPAPAPTRAPSAVPTAVATGAETGVIADGKGVSGLSAYAGHLVFSVHESGGYRLMQWHRGHVTTLPVPAQPRRFDADAGPDRHGRPVVVTMVAGYGSGACGFVKPLAPTAAGVGVFWLAAGASCDVTRTILAEADLHYLHPRSAVVGRRLIIDATRDTTATYWLQSPSATKPEAPYATACDHIACTITRGHPHWHAETPKRHFGPHPGGS